MYLNLPNINGKNKLHRIYSDFYNGRNHYTLEKMRSNGSWKHIYDSLTKREVNGFLENPSTAYDWKKQYRKQYTIILGVCTVIAGMILLFS